MSVARWDVLSAELFHCSKKADAAGTGLLKCAFRSGGGVQVCICPNVRGKHLLGISTEPLQFLRRQQHLA